MRRVLVLTQHFPPSSEVAGRVTARLLRYLPRTGWEPVVLTIPPEQSGAALDPSSFLDVVTQIRIERVARWPYIAEAVRVAGPALRFTRSFLARAPAALAPDTAPYTWDPAAPSRHAFSWAVPYFLFPDARVSWAPPAALRAAHLIARERFDAIWSVSPPGSTHLACWFLHRLFPSLPWILQLHDPWVSLQLDATENGRRRRLDRAAFALERACVQSAALVLLATQEMTARYQQRYPDVSEDRFGTLPNGYDPVDLASPEPPRGPPADGPLRLLHLGTVYGGRDPRPLIRGMAALVASGAATPEDLQLDLVGDVERKGGIEAFAREHGLERSVHLHGVVHQAEAAQRMSEAHVLVLLAQRQPEQIPAKLYEYISAGRFVLAFTSGASARLVSQTGAGRVLEDHDDAAPVLGELLGLHRDGRLDGWKVREDELQTYRAEHLASVMKGHLDRVVDSRPAPGGGREQTAARTTGNPVTRQGDGLHEVSRA